MLSLRTAIAAGIIATLTITLWGQPGAPPPKEEKHNPFTGDPKAITQGAVLFRQECVFCHGVAARGGMRGPDLTTGSWTHGGSDAELVRTITAGVPGTAMPPNKLTEEEIWQIVAYLRTVQQPVGAADRRRAARRDAVLRRRPMLVVPHRERTRRPARPGAFDRRLGASRAPTSIESIREPGEHLTREPRVRRPTRR